MQLRLFVAALPSDTVLNLLCAYTGNVRSATDGFARVRWEPRDNLHVTLRFIGNVDTYGFNATRNALRLCAKTLERCSARVASRPRAFGPNILYMPVEGLNTTADAVCEATKHIGKAPERRPFVGHITIARARRGATLPFVREAMDATEFEVNHIVLMKSTRDESTNETIYTALEFFPLGANGLED